MRTTVLPPRIGLNFGDRTWPAIPITLRGDSADLLFRDAPPARGSVRLRLDWEDGRVTELGARVRHVDEEFPVIRFDVREVAGDWKPFLAYLGEDAA